MNTLVLSSATCMHAAYFTATRYFIAYIFPRYPFEARVREGVTKKEAVEEVDIGGVTLLRAAAKNHARVVVLCDPADYSLVGDKLPQLSGQEREALAVKAFEMTANYGIHLILTYFLDTAISRFLFSLKLQVL